MAHSVGDKANMDTVLKGGHPKAVGQSQIRVKSFYLGRGWEVAGEMQQ